MAIQIKPRIAAFRRPSDLSSDGAKSMPQRYFVSPEIFADEREKIFSREWLFVGHQSQIPRSGDFFLATITGESLIIIRDSNLEIRGFFNVCRHRGTRLKEHRAGEASSCGHSSTIQCPYHAWTYGLDGRLVGAPHMDEVPGFDKADYSLHPVNLGVWQGFIFVNLANNPTPLEKRFAPLREKCSHWNMPILQSAKRIDYDVRANWKLMFENYSECYHCPGVHPQLQKVSPYDSAENDLREGPFLGGFMKINPGKSLTMTGNACAMFVGKIENLQQVFYYSIFPNMLLSLHPEYVMVHQLWPQSPERTLIICDWLFHPDAFAREDFRPDDAIEFWDMTNKQDWHVCELSQQGIASHAYEPGPYSSRESIPAAWDEYYMRVLNAQK
ncbi:MAG TPA: aromatic ring-hydroxylating dioxygenase subunit alpha [Chthoniobacterales bacterium]|nr:aromatic ring-hydroxylating dioxygenase subunit alpha [Chthoniobacterales bacterium]